MTCSRKNIKHNRQNTLHIDRDGHKSRLIGNIANPWVIYSLRKRQIAAKSLSSAEYEREILNLCKEMGL